METERITEPLAQSPDRVMEKPSVETEDLVQQLAAARARISELETVFPQGTEAVIQALLDKPVDMQDARQVALALWRARHALVICVVRQSPLVRALIERELDLEEAYKAHRAAFLDAVSHQCPETSLLERVLQRLAAHYEDDPEFNHSALLRGTSVRALCQTIADLPGAAISALDVQRVLERLTRLTMRCDTLSLSEVDGVRHVERLVDQPRAVAKLSWSAEEGAKLALCAEFLTTFSRACNTQ